MEIFRKSPVLLERAQKVFGDIVIEAYAGGYDHGFPEDVPEFLDKVQNFKGDSNISDLNFEDFCTVVLKFSNGNCVRFYTSEWGSAQQIKEENLKIV